MKMMNPHKEYKIRMKENEELIKPLGPFSTLAEVRKHAVTVGFPIKRVTGRMVEAAKRRMFPESRVQELKDGEIARCPRCSSVESRIGRTDVYPSGRTTRNRWCKNCGLQYATANEVSQLLVSKLVDIPERECLCCNKILPASMFRRRYQGRKPGALKSRCNDCYSQENHHRNIAKKLKSVGLTLKEYEIIKLQQGSVCIICGKESVIKEKCRRWQSLHIDHCHKTGKFRGLLCSRCNMGIGLFEDNPTLMQSAIDYLRKHAPEVKNYAE